MKNITLTLAIFSMTLVTSFANSAHYAETTGQKIDKTIDKANDKIQDAKDKANDKIKDAKEKVRDELK